MFVLSICKKEKKIVFNSHTLGDGLHFEDHCPILHACVVKEKFPLLFIIPTIQISQCKIKPRFL